MVLGHQGWEAASVKYSQMSAHWACVKSRDIFMCYWQMDAKKWHPFEGFSLLSPGCSLRLLLLMKLLFFGSQKPGHLYRWMLVGHGFFDLLIKIHVIQLMVFTIHIQEVLKLMVVLTCRTKAVWILWLRSRGSFGLTWISTAKCHGFAVFNLCSSYSGGSVVFQNIIKVSDNLLVVLQEIFYEK